MSEIIKKYKCSCCKTEITIIGAIKGYATCNCASWTIIDNYPLVNKEDIDKACNDLMEHPHYPIEIK